MTTDIALTDPVLLRLSDASTALLEARTIQEAKTIADVARAAEIYARRQKLGREAESYAHSIQVDALRLAGTMLRETPRNPGSKGQIQGSTDGSGGAILVPLEHEVPTLAELGLDKKTSSIAQKLVDLTEEEFESVKSGTVAVERAIQQAEKERRRDNIHSGIVESPTPTGTFDVLYADPPWKYDFSESPDRRSVENHYPVMNIE